MEFETKTVRLDIETQTIYQIAGYDSAGHLAFIQVTIGHRDKGDYKTPDEIDTAKSLLEVVCAQATELLRMGIDENDLLQSWRGTQFEPRGACPQLGQIVTSPLDAVARWLQAGIKKE